MPMQTNGPRPSPWDLLDTLMRLRDERERRREADEADEKTERSILSELGALVPRGGMKHVMSGPPHARVLWELERSGVSTTAVCMPLDDALTLKWPEPSPPEPVRTPVIRQLEGFIFQKRDAETVAAHAAHFELPEDMPGEAS